MVALSVSFLLTIMWIVGVFNLGYIFAAKVLGYKVTHSSIGYGPRLHKFTLGATTFELRLIPLGAYVNFKECEVSFRSLIFTCSGPLATLLLAFSITWLQLMTGFQVIVPKGAVIVESTGAVPALTKDDVITMAGDQPIRDGLDLFQKVTNWKSGELTLIAIRGGQAYQVKLNRSRPEKESKVETLGITFRSITETKRMRILEALKNAPEAALKPLLGSIAIAFTGASAFTGNFRRPNPITNTLTSPPLSGALESMSILSMSLSICNMLPIPVLVGGAAFIMTIELIRKRPFSEHDKERLQQVGFLIILLLMIVVIANDLRSAAGITMPLLPHINIERVASIIRWSGRNPYWSA